MEYSGFEDILNEMVVDGGVNQEDLTQKEKDIDNKGDGLRKNINDVDLKQLQMDVFASNKFDNKMKKDNKQNDASVIHSGHRQRARERFLLQLDKISDYDLLELLLFLIIPRADTKPLAKKMIDKYKTLKGVFDANVEALREDGVNGYALHYLYKLINITQKRILQQNLNKNNISIDNINDLATYCITSIGNLAEEQFRVLFLNSQLIIIDDVIFGLAGVSSVSISCRDIIKTSLELKATRVVLYHNHPNHNLIPSKDDLDTTAKIVNLLENIDVEVIDHLIVSGNKWFSFKQENLLP